MSGKFKLGLAFLFGVVMMLLFVPSSPFYWKPEVAHPIHVPTVEEQIEAQRQQEEQDYAKLICTQNYPIEIGKRFRYHGHVYVITKCVLRHGYAMIDDNRLWFFEHSDAVLETSNKIEVTLLPSNVNAYAGVEYEWYGAQLDFQAENNKVKKL